MATGFTRQSAADIVTSNTIQASHFNAEYNLLQSSFDASTGHNHDGTTGGGAKIPPAGLVGLTSTSAGLLCADGANSNNARTLTGTANEITITNGTGASGNPTISLPTALTFTGKTVTGGTFTTPTININANVLSIRDNTDTTKIAQFICSTIDTSTTRSFTFPNASGTVALTSDISALSSTYQPLDATLTALAGYNTNGVLVQTGTDTFSGRTITGTSNRLTVVNGDGVSGNPTIDISSSYIGQSTITTLGTISTGTWNADVLTGQYGGTGVANTGKTITLGGNLVTSGANSLTFTTTGTTNITVPTTGTLSTLAGTETFTNKTLTSPTLTSPALGTPSSGTLTSCTGLPLTTGVTGTLPVANGGTGATSLTANNVILGNGTSAVQFVAPSTSGNVLTSNGTTWISSTPANLTLATAQNSTSGTSIEFTSLPSTIKRISVVFSGVSTNGSSNLLIQLGAGSFTTSGYSSSNTQGNGGAGTTSSTAGHLAVTNTSGTHTIYGIATFINISGNNWVGSATLFNTTSTTSFQISASGVDIGGTLDRIRVTTVNGTDTFDAGIINVLYE